MDLTTFSLPSLQVLWLHNNKISRIKEEVFKGLMNLTEVNLESNKIVTFNKNALIGLSKLKKVCLFDNPINNNLSFIKNIINK